MDDVSTTQQFSGEQSMGARTQGAFRHLTSDWEANRMKFGQAYYRLRDLMETPLRAYHNESHIDAVLAQIYAWTDNRPSVPLTAASLYHDVIYDATKHDNELQSAVVCHDALTTLGIVVSDIVQATNLILATQYHRPHIRNRDEILIVDADLYVLGSDREDYAAYVSAIRAEYHHVPEPDWRSGRRAVMERFLKRERIYSGDWPGREEREGAARANIAREIDGLEW